MSDTGRPGRLFLRKSIDHIREEATSHGMKRTLGPLNLVFLGIGCIIGAGIYVMIGNAAANFAGPAVILSFVIAGIACAFAGLCYAELSSTMPVSGSSYTYAYATLGELFAWIMGWLLVLEYGTAAATVAVGFSGYAVNFLKDFGVVVPAALSQPFITSIQGPEGLQFVASGGFNLVAALGIAAVCGLLLLGVSESAKVNNVIVFTKVTVLLAFIAFGAFHIMPDNWKPFIPPNQGGFTYGPQGIFRAASTIFFAYLGFEAVSTAASEAKNPQKDMPVGIIGSLIVCTLVYMAVAAVMTGVVPYRNLGVANPIAVAVDAMNIPALGFAIKVGSVAGLFSVMLILTYGQSRIFFAMARDGLLPPLFCALHPRFRTPWAGTIVLATLIALAAGLLPITILGDLVSLGTATAFAIVCISVMWLRSSRPDLERPFRVPLGGIWIGKAWIGVTPVLGVLGALVMGVPVILDIAHKAVSGDPIPAMLLGGYALLGAVIYIAYGLNHSRLAGGVEVIPPPVAQLDPPV